MKAITIRGVDNNLEKKTKSCRKKWLAERESIDPEFAAQKSWTGKR